MDVLGENHTLRHQRPLSADPLVLRLATSQCCSAGLSRRSTIGAFSLHCNIWHRILELGANASRSARRYGPRAHCAPPA
jgi:hypothetical protein